MDEGTFLERRVELMKILIVGATGRVGKILQNQLAKASNYEVVGTSSHEVDGYLHLDLHASVKDIVAKIEGFDVIYFVAGSRGKDLLQTDLNGAVKLMQAAELTDVKRYIQLSSAFALDQTMWNQGYLKDLTDYNIAKYFSDNWLINNTKLNYTILQPGALLEKTGTGKITTAQDQIASNPIEDVANVLAELLHHDNTVNQVIMMSSGDTPISEALQKI
jgi:nucleoside-diphosphate-sugar epimerase